jgi:hypothetical protein
MSKALIVFAAWCFVWSLAALSAAYYGWSPYAEANGRAAQPPVGGHGGYGGGHFYGPMHK